MKDFGFGWFHHPRSSILRYQVLTSQCEYVRWFQLDRANALRWRLRLFVKPHTCNFLHKFPVATLSEQSVYVYIDTRAFLKCCLMNSLPLWKELDLVRCYAASVRRPEWDTRAAVAYLCARPPPPQVQTAVDWTGIRWGCSSKQEVGVDELCSFHSFSVWQGWGCSPTSDHSSLHLVQ